MRPTDHFVNTEYMQSTAQTRTTLAQILVVAFIFLVLNLVVIYLAQQYVPYNTRGFPYKDFVDQYHLPLLLQPLANFDGAQYIIVAADKYFTYQQAYFPLYPVLIRLFAPLAQYNYAITGILLSVMSFVGGLFVLHKLARSVYPETNLNKSTLHPMIPLLLVLPCSFFFMAVYTESLFLLFTLGTIYCVYTRKSLFASLFGYLAALTRFAGILLLLPIGVELLVHHKKYSVKQMVVLFMGPIAGLLTYMSYLYFTTHDALAFIHSQTAFSNNRSTSAVFLPQVLYRYLKIFTTASFDINYAVAILEFGVFMVYFTLLSVGMWNTLKNKAWRNHQNSAAFGILLFSIANLILPTLTGTLGSVPRYSLVSIAMLPIVLQTRPWFRWVFVATSVALHMIVLALFSQGWFVS